MALATPRCALGGARLLSSWRGLAGFSLSGEGGEEGRAGMVRLDWAKPGGGGGQRGGAEGVFGGFQTP